MTQNIHTMSRYDPKRGKLFHIEVLGLFILLNVIPKIQFLGKFGPETWKYFV